MGLSFISHFSDSKPLTKAFVSPSRSLPPNPNPFRYRVKKRKVVNGNLILLVHYPDCTTFSGMKLLLLRGANYTKGNLDPHILGNNHPVIARFEPNEVGWGLAEACAEKLVDDTKINIYLFSTYRDGGTKVYTNRATKKRYYLDRRIRSQSPNQLFDRYPGDDGAKILDKGKFNLIDS
jgi:hypothetical protein